MKALKAQMPLLSLLTFVALSALADSRPNILFCISDDQSYAHTGANGDPVVKTPTFDRLAKEGAMFRHAYVSSPSCTPSRIGIMK